MHKDEVFLKEAEALHSLRALEEIEKNPKISQRELSNRLGVALGITNALLKTLVRKGLIKIRGENNRTLTYHLTHAGVLAKGRLAMKWTLNTIDFYRQARQDMAYRLASLVAEGIETVALNGNGELTEIAMIVAPEVGLKVVGVIGDPKGNSDGVILGHPIIKPEQLVSIELDAIIVCVDADNSLVEKLGQYYNGIKLYYLI